MKSLHIILLVLVLAAVALALISPQTVKDFGHRVNDALFGYMGRAGLALFAEVKSTQTTAVAAGYKLLPSADGGKIRNFYARFVNGASTLAINDTIYLGDLPKGARIRKDWVVNCGAGTASCVLDIGLRVKSTGTVIDADGIAADVNAAAAGYKDANTGALIAAGAEYITTAEVEVYATVEGAVFAASQAMTVEGTYVQD